MTLQPFNYIAVDSLQAAEELLRQCGDGAAVMAGGTDLMGTLKDAIHPHYPELVVSLKTVPGLRYIEEDAQGLRIGSLTTLDDIAEHPAVRGRYPALAEAARSVAAGQIRNVATIAGNICQEPRCWYYRNPDNTFECLRKGGTRCNALFGENRYHSIFGAMRVDAPPCVADCPIRTDIPTYMALIRAGDIAGAAQILLDCNPLAAITGRVCPHTCEDECNRRDGDEAVSIRDVERYLGDTLLAHAAEYYTPPAVESGKSVGVIGSGPAGLTAAYHLRKAGHAVVVYEQMPVAGGMLTYSIPAYRLPKDVVQAQIRALEGMGIRFELGARLGADERSLAELKARHDGLVLAVGLWKSRSLRIENETLLTPGLEFLIQVQQGHAPAVGRHVIVVGGGSVAVDVAITARRLGAEKVTMAFLESRATMPALDEDIKQALLEGIDFLPSFGPMRVLSEGGQVTGIEFMRCTSVFDEEGRFAPCYDTDERIVVEADQTLYAIGQAADLTGIEGQAQTARGLITAHPETQATSLAGVVACGDVTRGPSTVVNAIAEGRRAAAGLEAYLGGQPAPAAVKPVALTLNTAAFRPLARVEAAELPLAERRLRVEDKATLPLARVNAEADRCANCGCVAVNASDVAPVLLALGATIKTTRREIPADAFFAATVKRTTALEADELVSEIFVPAPAPETRQGYLKFRLRNAIDFPIVGLAYAWEQADGRVSNARLVAGGVAGLPLRLTEAEALLEEQRAEHDVLNAAATGAQPLARNRYKVAVLQGLLRKALARA